MSDFSRGEISVFLRIVEFGSANPKGFTFHEMYSGLRLENWEWEIIRTYLRAAHENARAARLDRGLHQNTPFLEIDSKNADPFADSSKYIITYSAYFDYLDYLELQEARKSAQEARRWAIWAVLVALAAMVVSAVVPFLVAIYVTQDVRLAGEQFNRILEDLPDNTLVPSSAP